MRKTYVWYGEDAKEREGWLARQWKRHGADFPECSNAEEYAARARDLLNSHPLAIRSWREAPRFVYFLDEPSNVLVVATSAYRILSMLVPRPCFHGSWNTQQFLDQRNHGLQREDPLCCLSCGWQPPRGWEFLPFDICKCCGFQKGYDFFSIHRLRWFRGDHSWFEPRARPLQWSHERQAENIPKDWTFELPVISHEWLFRNTPPDAWREPLSDEDLRRCRACGYLYDFYPWGPGGIIPEDGTCSCCGCEWGTDDSLFAWVIWWRLDWLDKGAPWWDRGEYKLSILQPPGWDLEAQLRSIPMQFRMNL